MTTREMHYDFKRKFNKIDSQKNRNLLDNKVLSFGKKEIIGFLMFGWMLKEISKN